MNEFKFSTRSIRAMEGVDKELVEVAYRALELTTVDFIIVEGVRSIATQRRYVDEGKSKTMNSRHLYGKALDFVAYVDGRASYDLKHMKKIADAFKEAARELSVKIVWGGDWKTFKDTPHIELDRSVYPDKGEKNYV